MNKIDYNQIFKSELVCVANNQIYKKLKPSLILHTCCAVCASGVLWREFSFENTKKTLSDFFDITLYFYNPNIDAKHEYLIRANEVQKLLVDNKIANIILAPHLSEEFSHINKKDCTSCIDLRLSKTAAFAFRDGADYFSTTLSVSPHKNSTAINELGLKIQKTHAIKFMPADFKKENGFAVAGVIATELELYRQSYCGCTRSNQLN